MNQEHGELLSAYLDGALTGAERADLEARLQSSPDLRRELEELRAVSAAVKSFPKEPLPAGFLSRLDARRARPARKDWVFLPPMARPIAFALSCGVVALVVWDKTVTSPEPAAVHSLNEAAVSDQASAPVSQLNLSENAGSAVIGGAAAKESIDALQIAGAASEPARRGDTAPRLDEKFGIKPAGAYRKTSFSRRQARAPGAPADGSDLISKGALAMTEEERSAKNEQMIDYIEVEKKKMGIARVVPKSDVSNTMNKPSATPTIMAASPALLKTAAMAKPAEPLSDDRPAAIPAAGRLAPDAGLVFSDARSLASSWVLLGFPGQPPSVDFGANRVVLIKPSASKIVSVTPTPNSINVVFHALSSEESALPASDRVAVIPLQPRAVLIFDATPR